MRLEGGKIVTAIGDMAFSDRVDEGADLFWTIVRNNYVTNIDHAAYEAYMNGDDEGALLLNLMAANQGSNLAVSNAAWLLEKKRGVQGEVGKYFPGGTDYLMISLLSAAADSGSVESMLCLGDMYFYGRGVEKNAPLAAEKYLAASGHGSAQGFFNLAIMHQYGLGLEQDFHLAKRYFDHAQEMAEEAEYPAKIARFLLRLHEILHSWQQTMITIPAGESFSSSIILWTERLVEGSNAYTELVILSSVFILLIIMLGLWRRYKQRILLSTSSEVSLPESEEDVSQSDL